MKINIINPFLSLLLILHLSVNTMELPLPGKEKQKMQADAISVQCADNITITIPHEIAILLFKHKRESFKEGNKSFEFNKLNSSELGLLVSLVTELKHEERITDDFLYEENKENGKLVHKYRDHKLIKNYLNGPSQNIQNLIKIANTSRSPFLKALIAQCTEKSTISPSRKKAVWAVPGKEEVDDLAQDLQKKVTINNLSFIKPSNNVYSVDDDIKSPTNWKQVQGPHYQLPDIFTHGVYKIRNRFFYNYDPQINGNSRILFLVIHGTRGSTTDSYFVDEDKNKESDNFRHIKRFASHYSTEKNKGLELLSYLWTENINKNGAVGCSDNDRIDGAKILNQFLHHLGYENIELVTLSHSHGCNVVNYLCQKIPQQ